MARKRKPYLSIAQIIGYKMRRSGRHPAAAGNPRPPKRQGVRITESDPFSDPPTPRRV